MLFSRRGFLRTVAAGTAASPLARWPSNQDKAAPSLTAPSERNQEGFLLLDCNENAYGPSEVVLAAIRGSLGTVNRYAFREYDTLRENIAHAHNIDSNRVVPGCGSTEVMRVAANALLGRGRKLITATPTYGDLGSYAQACGAEVVTVPLTHDYAHDLNGMLARVDDKVGIVYICNPNNPTGSITPRKDIENFLARLPTTTCVLIDEAYHHYVEPSGRYSSFIDQPIQNPRLIVTRTFSTIYAMAGLRLGYGVAEPELVERMSAYRTRIDLNGVAVAAGRAALADPASVRDFAKRNTDDRQEFFNQAQARMLKPIDSHTNFFMMDTNQPGTEVIAYFRKNKILIAGPFETFPRHIRVSLGTPNAMTEFWRVWDQMPGPKMSM